VLRVNGVPSALQAMLIRPFVNEKAKSILEKLSAEILGDYTRLRAALLQEFKLSANVQCVSKKIPDIFSCNFNCNCNFVGFL